MLDQLDTRSGTNHLTFRLGDELFSIEVQNVREILDISTITRVPGTPRFMRGIINVRGSIVPVADLRMKLGLAETKQTSHTRIIVLELSVQGEILQIGAMADAVEDVFSVEPAQIEKPPKIGTRWKTEHVKGIGKKEGQFFLILDIHKLFLKEDAALLESLAGIAKAETAGDMVSATPQ